MGKRDYRQREKKKPRKDEKKAPVTTTVAPTQGPVEIIKRGKKEQP
jgi:hypothetical protein